MVNETRDFGLATALTAVGLLVMLWGVTLNNGTAFNTPMIAGGAVVAVGIGIILVSVMRLEGPDEAH
ncbi:MAG: hypothetical protein U5J98_09295 [Halobacteriales archaeon]|nr:hypothetical protein [Halobacteriales archaeon]